MARERRATAFTLATRFLGDDRLTRPGRHRRDPRGGGAQRPRSPARARAPRGVPRRARHRLRAARGRAGRRGPFERDVPRPPRRHRGRRAPPAAPAAAAERARRRCARRGCSRASRAPPRACRRSSRVCEDESVIGAPFYVMERLARRGDHDARCRPRSTRPSERRRIGEQLVDALVEIHGVDWQRCLEGFGKPTGYLERQVRRFTGLWEHSATREVEAVDRVGAGWARTCPSPAPRRSSTATSAWATRCSPPRRPPALRGVRLGDGDDRRPAGRHRLHVRDVERGRRPAGRQVRARARHPRRGLPDARRAHRPLRGALGPRGPRPAPGTRRSRSGSPSCSWRATTAARSRAARTTRT